MSLTSTIRAAFGAIVIAAVAVPAVAQDKGTIGIAMPTKSITRWIADGDNMVKYFEDAGYDTILQYADDDIPTQVAQLENMVAQGVDALVIAAIDGTTLGNVLEQAEASDIPVISYDRLIRDSGNVDYYTTFDNFKVGVLQAESIVAELDMEACNPCNVELFGGSPDDNNAYFFYNGAMSVLQPLIDEGKLAVKSGQTGMNVVGTQGWMASGAQSRMENLLSANYTGDTRVDAVLAPNDSLAIGIISALKGVGYGSADQPMPAISGQDGEIPSLKAIEAGEQTSTVFKDTRELAQVTVRLVDAVLNDREPEINDTETYDNGVKVVPSYLLTPVAVTKGNLKATLIDSGYYTEDQLK